MRVDMVRETQVQIPTVPLCSLGALDHSLNLSHRVVRIKWRGGE